METQGHRKGNELLYIDGEPTLQIGDLVSDVLDDERIGVVTGFNGDDDPYVEFEHNLKAVLCFRSSVRFEDRPGFVMSDEEDTVNHPSHYTADPSGVECIEVVEHRNFCIGNAIKYLWRAGLKGGDAKQVEDLRKSIWYIEREIERLSNV